MDPDATLNLLFDAFDALDWQRGSSSSRDLRDHACALREWVDRGGYVPKGMLSVRTTHLLCDLVIAYIEANRDLDR